jgi:hypothetical protein
VCRLTAGWWRTYGVEFIFPSTHTSGLLPIHAQKRHSPSVWAKLCRASVAWGFNTSALCQHRKYVAEQIPSRPIPPRGENRKCFQENSLMRHVEGCILGILPLALARSSLGLGQDDRVLVAFVTWESWLGQEHGYREAAAEPIRGYEST